MQPRVIYVDVDHTLIHFEGETRQPARTVVERIRKLHAQGETLYLWSSGGADYARSVAVELGIADLFVACLPKPHTYIDDLPVSDWIDCEHSLPGGVDAF